MNLKDVKMLIDSKCTEIGELVNRRNTAVLNTYRFVYGTEMKFEENYMINAPHEYSVDELTEKIEKLNDEVLALRDALYFANATTKVTYSEKEMSLSSVIFLLKTKKDMLPSIKKLSDIKERRDMISPTRYSEAIQTFIDVAKPTYDTKTYRSKSKEIENEILTLQSLIDKTNIETYVELRV